MQYQRHLLPNGLRVITVPMPSFESVTVLVMVGAGSRYETRDDSGISHFLEHMAFKGTAKRPSALAISSLIDGIGGEFNAFTGKETTGYYIKSQATHMDLSLDVLSDMLQNSLLDPVEIDKERGVIIEELNLYEDTPMRKIGDVYERMLYGDTPMGWDIGGEKDIINKISKQDFIDYMQSLYSAHNITVVIAGGIKPADALKKTEKYFGKMKKFETKAYPLVVEGQTAPELFIKEKKTEQVHIAIGFRTVSTDHKDRYPLSLLAAILGGGMSSRLFHEVREKRGLGYYVRTSSDHYQDVGSIATYAGVDPKRVEEAIEVIVGEYRDLASGKSKITEEEVTKAKEFQKGHLVLELEDSRSVGTFYASQELLEENIDNPEEILRKTDEVSLEDVSRVAKQYFRNETLNMAVIGNFTSGHEFKKLLRL